MGSYNNEYKKYYQGVQGKNVMKSSSPVYKMDQYENLSSKHYPRRQKKEFFSSMANVFIYQLGVVIFMLMAAFYLKYSPSNQSSYENVKAVMNTNTYTEPQEDSSYWSISEVVNKVSNYIKLNLDGE